MKPIILGKAAEVCLIQAVGGHDVDLLETEYQRMVKQCGESFLLAAFLVDDWNRNLSPWKAPAVFPGEDFGGGAPEALSYVLEELLPFVQTDYHLPKEGVRYILGGYSLAGLFSLWATYQTDRFSACMAASPSLWFPGWIDYAKTHEIRTDQIYLSLGDREEKTRHPILSGVGNAIREQEQLLQNKHCLLEYNPGNHFTHPEERVAKGFVWCMDRVR